MKLTSPALALVLLALAGCGGDEGNSFTEDYNQAVKPLSELQGDLGTEPKQFDRLAGRAAQTRKNLAALDAPADADDELKKLLAGLDDVTRDLKAVAKAARDKDPAEQQKAAKQLVESSSQVQQAETALKDAVGG